MSTKVYGHLIAVLLAFASVVGVAERPEVRFHLEAGGRASWRALEASRAKRRSELLLNLEEQPEPVVAAQKAHAKEEGKQDVNIPMASVGIPALGDRSMPLRENTNLTTLAAGTNISALSTWLQRLVPPAAPAVLFVECIFNSKVLRDLPGYAKFGGLVLLLLLCGHVLPGAWHVLARSGHRPPVQKRMSEPPPTKRMHSGKEHAAAAAFTPAPHPLPMPGYAEGPKIKGPLAVRRAEAAAAAAASVVAMGQNASEPPPRSNFRRGTPGALPRASLRGV